MSKLFDFYKNKKVFITGHTGFKGSWMCKVLAMAGAEVYGYSLEPPTNPSLFSIAKIKSTIEESIIGDISDLENLKYHVNKTRPDIIIHMAAQPIVRESYVNPVYTYQTNVMGTVNILEALRFCDSVRSFVNVTTDKVYRNNEWEWGYRENEYLDGYDPYSNSKSCSELITSSYKKSFFKDIDVSISTCRAGNVIGGGDFASDRIIPDCIRAVEKGEKIIVRNPYSIRPYQYVLDPVFAYLYLAMIQYDDRSYADCYNIGPNDSDCIDTGKLVSSFCKYWGQGIEWEVQQESNAPHEANYLRLDCSKIKFKLGWNPVWNIEKAVEKTVEWGKAYLQDKSIESVMKSQIQQFLKDSLM